MELLAWSLETVATIEIPEQRLHLVGTVGSKADLNVDDFFGTLEHWVR